MIKLGELVKLKKMVYSEEVKPKHRNRMHMPLSVFREDLQLPYGIGKSRLPDNDSQTTYRELKFLASVKPNLSVVKEGDEVEIVLTFFDHDRKRLHFKMEMIEKSSKKLSATIEMLALYIDLSKRKVAEFEDKKIKIMDDFINENKNEFNFDNLKIIGKLKK